jgi:hypothetical protein
VKLVTTSLTIYKRNLLTYYLNHHDVYSIKEIRAGINAFTLLEKELKETNLPLKEAVIIRAFRVTL